MNLHQDGDRIVVTDLRPMTDYPKIPDGQLQVFVLVYLNFTDLPVLVPYDPREEWPADQALLGIGWIYPPVYDPLFKGEDKFQISYGRYEKLRKLNPRQFAELYERNIRGEGSFDDLVDQLPFGRSENNADHGQDQ